MVSSSLYTVTLGHHFEGCFQGTQDIYIYYRTFLGVSFKMLEGSNPELLQRGLRE